MDIYFMLLVLLLQPIEFWLLGKWEKKQESDLSVEGGSAQKQKPTGKGKEMPEQKWKLQVENKLQEMETLVEQLYNEIELLKREGHSGEKKPYFPTNSMTGIKTAGTDEERILELLNRDLGKTQETLEKNGYSICATLELGNRKDVTETMTPPIFVEAKNGYFGMIPVREKNDQYYVFPVGDYFPKSQRLSGVLPHLFDLEKQGAISSEMQETYILSVKKLAKVAYSREKNGYQLVRENGKGRVVIRG